MIINTTEFVQRMDVDDLLKLAEDASEHIRINTGKDIEFYIGYNDEIHVIEGEIERFTTFDLDHAINTIFEQEGLVW